MYTHIFNFLLWPIYPFEVSLLRFAKMPFDQQKSIQFLSGQAWGSWTVLGTGNPFDFRR